MIALFIMRSGKLLSQSASANFKISKDILDLGGQPSQSSQFMLRESLGWTVETGQIRSVNFNLEGGFLFLGEQRIASISGFVSDYDGQDPIEGVSLEAHAIGIRETTTDQSGNYVFPNFKVGNTITIRPLRSGWFFQPGTRIYAPLDNHQENQDFTGSLFGDVSGNDDIQAFDASMVLRYAVGAIDWQDPERDSTAADVSGNGSVKGYDASLILQYSAGIITEFPADWNIARRGVPPAPSNTVPIVRLKACPLIRGETVTIPIGIEDADAVYSADFKLSYHPAILKFRTLVLNESHHGFFMVYREEENIIRCSLGGSCPLSGNHRVIHLTFDVLADVSADLSRPVLEIMDAGLNDGYPDALLINESFETPAVPERFVLHQNTPNPFNPETIIRYQIPPGGIGSRSGKSSGDDQVTGQDLHVIVRITNILGHEVRTLVDEVQKPGEYEVVWDGRDKQGRQVTSGLYFYSLKAGGFTDRKKMMLLQ